MNAPTGGMIPIDEILPNPEQPRKRFDRESLEELAASIRANGVIQPVIVEQAGESYILHDGERRVRAARLAGLNEVPAVVMAPMNGGAGAANSLARLERAMVANLQREDLSPIEEARACARLLEMLGNPARVASRLGKSDPWVRNRLLLLELDEEIQELIERGVFPHDQRAVRAVLDIPDRAARLALARRAAERRSSIKAVVAAAKMVTVNLQMKADPDEIPALLIGLGKLPQGKAGREVAAPAWDALRQAGRLPPWELVRESARETCDKCVLRPIASEQICGECPLPEMIARLIREAEHVAV